MIDRLLPRSPAIRGTVVAVAVAAATLFLTQVVFPGSPGGARGTPAAILFSGLVNGLATAVFACGVVLVYRTMRFVNFSQGPMGVVGVTALTYMLVFTEVPFPLALLISLAVSAGLGAVAGVFLLRFLNASRLFLTVVTIVGGAFIIQSAVPFVQRLPFWPGPDRLSTSELQDLSAISDDLPLAGFDFHVGSFKIDFGFNHLLALELSILALVGLGVFLRFTRTGTAVRAMAENPERASLLGIGVGGLSVVVWTIAGLLDGVATFASFSAGSGTTGGEFSVAILLLPLAPAVIAKFRSIPVAVFAAVILGVLRESYFYSYSKDTELFSLALLVIVGVGLLVQRRALARSQAAAAVSWSATDAPRPIPHELRSISSIRNARRALLAVGTIGILALPFVLSEGRIFLASSIFIHAIAVLSLVVLTGWAGQVSLGQYGMVGVGSVVGGALTAKVGMPFWVAVPAGVALCAAIAVVVGLPALRIRGLFLLVVTFGFAVVVSQVLFADRYFGWLIPDVVDRPTLFFLDFEDNASMYYLCLAGLVLAIVVVRNLRRSRVGRLLIALRENEPNVQSFGLSPVRLKLLAFAIAGGLAGFAGVLFAHQQLGVSAGSFDPAASLTTFTAAVVGGVSSPGGAVLGAAYVNLIDEFASSSVVFTAFFQGAGPLVILFLVPGGLIAIVNSVRDSVLRVVAQRRQIVVPSLFADYDPDLLAHRLIPLGPEDVNGGLAALPADERYTLLSALYKGRGPRILDRLAGVREDKDATALAAAAKSVESADDAAEAAFAGPAPEAATR